MSQGERANGESCVEKDEIGSAFLRRLNAYIREKNKKYSLQLF